MNKSSLDCLLLETQREVLRWDLGFQVGDVKPRVLGGSFFKQYIFLIKKIFLATPYGM